MKSKRCYHDRNSWILGGVWQWCYRCGALQRLEAVPDGTSNPPLMAVTGWQRPVGPDGQNPQSLPLMRRRESRRDG
jgi:hypothetical protein